VAFYLLRRGHLHHRATRLRAVQFADFLLKQSRDTY
jgi:hypothetical protein